jgi:hypothetical protein
MTGREWKLEDDYQHVTLSLPDQDIKLVFDVPAVDEVLQNLGDFRGNMKPEIPKTYAMGQKVKAINDPAWVTELELMQGNTLLHLCDPRYGWLHYSIPREEARKLAQYLQNQVDAQLPGQQSGKAN